MLEILRVLEDGNALPLFDRETGIDPQHLRGLRFGLLNLAQLGIGRRQPLMRKLQIGLARRPLAEQGDGLHVTPQLVIGAAPGPGPTDDRRKGVEAQVCFQHLDGPSRLAQRDQDPTKSMVYEIGVEGEGAFELGDRSIRPVLSEQGPSQPRVRQR
jgi:hypothetical protein